MSSRSGIFAGDDPFAIVQDWMKEAQDSELNDPNAIALATNDNSGMPNVRIVLLKGVEKDAFVFYTNYGSQKALEIEATGTAAFVMHWKSLRRQIRVRGHVSREDGAQADAYFASRSLQSRIGAWASKQSQPLKSKSSLLANVAKETAKHGTAPTRPPFWGGFRLIPTEIEFWADGAFRLHDRFAWRRSSADENWEILRLNP
ncbi:pyridoxamine 5'-phosphate oxidase [Halocynthiibacter namhaensis]|uniref:pyridoxamine 5'-phosphate oxidase n=1 Tax=Halocynthiibacter namhaensis TaxID=1290553 RepID=UPI00057969F5|nr:pyridoxamine 5'-phosphate oxidase [Halocynthiibacter namhaensis]